MGRESKQNGERKSLLDTGREIQKHMMRSKRGVPIVVVQLVVMAAVAVVVVLMLASKMGFCISSHLRSLGMAAMFFGWWRLWIFVDSSGFLASARNVRVVRIGRVKLTIPQDRHDAIFAEALKDLEDMMGPKMHELFEGIRKQAKTGEPEVRSSLFRPLPVLVDWQDPELYWAVENAMMVRDTIKGYPSVRVQFVKPEEMNSHLPEQLARWQMLRARVAQTSNREIARKLKEVEVVFVYPDYRYPDIEPAERLQAQFRCPISSRSCKNSSVKKEYRSIEELEAKFSALIEEACRLDECRSEARRTQAAKDMALQRESSTAKNPAAAVEPFPAQPRQNPTCRKGHTLKAYTKRVTSACDSCNTRILKGETVMICQYYPACNWFACQRCVPPDSIEEVEETSLCVCCLDETADMVMRGCGHLVYCVTCCRRSVAMTLGTVKLKDIKASSYENTKVECPICRQESCMAAKRSFNKQVFRP